MVRAFAVLSLLLSVTLFAACYSSSHASPARGQAIAVAGPEDPYAEYGAQVVEFGVGAWCPPGQTCEFECPEGNCAFKCAEGSTCNAECDGGRCSLACAGGATCNLECDGGQCGLGCADGSTCNMECDGGSCAQACGTEATCNTECDGGNCS